MTDEAGQGFIAELVPRLHPGLQKMFLNMERMQGFQTVAEVVRSERCLAGVQVGDHPGVGGDRGRGDGAVTGLEHDAGPGARRGRGQSGVRPG